MIRRAFERLDPRTLSRGGEILFQDIPCARLPSLLEGQAYLPTVVLKGVVVVREGKKNSPQSGPEISLANFFFEPDSDSCFVFCKYASHHPREQNIFGPDLGRFLSSRTLLQSWAIGNAPNNNSEAVNTVMK